MEMDILKLTGHFDKSINILTKDDNILSFANQNNKWNKAEDANDVVKAIEESKELKGLELEANTLGVEAAKAIGDALATHPEFERAYWKDLFTGRLKTEIPQALKHLFSGLIRAKAKLKELDLSDNALGPVGVEGMVDFMKSPVCYSLEELRLNNNGLGIKGGTMLAKSLLELVKNAEAAGSPLKLKVFVCGRNRLEKEGATIFAKFFSAVGSMEEIVMPQNGISHHGIAALAEAFSLNPNLKIINLNDNTFTSKGAEAMANYLPSMTNLEIINFGDCLVKTKGAISLAKSLTKGHYQLKELHLDGNEITAEGVVDLVNALENKENMELLMIDCNQFGEIGQDLLMNSLDAIGKVDVLGSLDDDQELDSEDSSESGSGNEDDDDDDYEDIDEEEYEIIGDQEVPEVVPASLPKFENIFTPVNQMSIQETTRSYLVLPNAPKLLTMGESAPSLLLKEAHFNAQPKETKESAENFNGQFINECFTMVMKTSLMTGSMDPKVQKLVDSCTNSLAEAAFQVKESNLATNSLLIHLGIIKSEDKNFKILWDLKNCLLVLAKLVLQPFFPLETKETLRILLSIPECKLNSYPEEIQKVVDAIG